MNSNTSKLCRICLDNDNSRDIISPCLCKDGSAYVHRKCLDHWRSVNKSGSAFKFCDVCRFEYVIESVVYDPLANRERLQTFRLLMTRDIMLVILFIQLIILAMAFLVKFADQNHHYIKDLFPSSMNELSIYYLSVFILFLAILGFLGLIIVLIFTMIGVFVAVFLAVKIIRSIINRHMDKLWLQQEVKKYIVSDFQENMHELNEISIRRRIMH